jgi:hypothetical protein
MSTDHNRQAEGKRIMAEIVAIPAILAFPPEVYAQLFSKSYQDPVAYEEEDFIDPPEWEIFSATHRRVLGAKANIAIEND